MKFQNCNSQCAPGFSDLKQKVHGVSHSWIYKISESVEKTINHQASKIHFYKLAKKSHQWTSFSIENPRFEDYCFGSLMTDGFFNWFWSVLYIPAISKWKSPWSFWYGLEKTGTHCGKPSIQNHIRAPVSKIWETIRRPS